MWVLPIGYELNGEEEQVFMVNGTSRSGKKEWTFGWLIPSID
jgi:hypothetical protein